MVQITAKSYTRVLGFVGRLARRLAYLGQWSDWLGQCQYAVTGESDSFDLKPSQSGSLKNG